MLKNTVLFLAIKKENHIFVYIKGPQGQGKIIVIL